MVMVLHALSQIFCSFKNTATYHLCLCLLLLKSSIVWRFHLYELFNFFYLRCSIFHSFSLSLSHGRSVFLCIIIFISYRICLVIFSNFYIPIIAFLELGGSDRKQYIRAMALSHFLSIIFFLPLYLRLIWSVILFLSLSPSLVHPNLSHLAQSDPAATAAAAYANRFQAPPIARHMSGTESTRQGLKPSSFAPRKFETWLGKFEKTHFFREKTSRALGSYSRDTSVEGG